MSDYTAWPRWVFKEIMGNSCYYAFTRFFPRGGIRILAYHSLEKGDQDNFRGQMLYLKRKGYQGLGLEVLPAYLKGALKMPERAFILTFDDGFKDNYLYAWPVIKELGLKATFFLAYNYIGTPRRYWWEAKKEIFSWEEITEMKKDGQSFGSHSLSHANLLDLSEKAMVNEVRDSKLRLEERLGLRINFFSYPYGFWNSAVVEAVKASGYRGACTVRYGVSFSSKDFFTLGRINITPYETLDSFKKKISGSFDWLKMFGPRNRPRLKIG